MCCRCCFFLRRPLFCPRCRSRQAGKQAEQERTPLIQHSNHTELHPAPPASTSSNPIHDAKQIIPGTAAEQQAASSQHNQGGGGGGGGQDNRSLPAEVLHVKREGCQGTRPSEEVPFLQAVEGLEAIQAVRLVHALGEALAMFCKTAEKTGTSGTDMYLRAQERKQDKKTHRKKKKKNVPLYSSIYRR